MSEPTDQPEKVTVTLELTREEAEALRYECERRRLLMPSDREVLASKIRVALADPQETTGGLADVHDALIAKAAAYAEGAESGDEFDQVASDAYNDAARLVHAALAPRPSGGGRPGTCPECGASSPFRPLLPCTLDSHELHPWHRPSWATAEEAVEDANPSKGVVVSEETVEKLRAERDGWRGRAEGAEDARWAAVAEAQGLAVTLAEEQESAGNVEASLRHDAAKAREERDLAIAHDRQPYPTAEAYEKVCAARTKWQERAERLGWDSSAPCTCRGEREEAPPEPDPDCPQHGALQAALGVGLQDSEPEDV